MNPSPDVMEEPRARARAAPRAPRTSDSKGEPRARARAAHQTPGSDTAPHKPRVLIVDDEVSILASMRRLLRREPYELITATSGEEALRAMEAEPAPLVITDYRMPGMTGTELLREVQRRWPDTVRMVLSGYSEAKAIITAINEGAIYKFVSKPWNDEEIRLHIRRALEQYALAAENRRLVKEIRQQNEQLRELNELLDQRATDASTGLTCSQELLESIDVGVLAVDEAGLVVSANLRTIELLSGRKAEFMGVPVQTVLPDGLHEALFSESARTAGSRSGRVVHRGRSLQWRARSIDDEGRCRGTVVAFWEDVPCRSN